MISYTNGPLKQSEAAEIEVQWRMRFAHLHQLQLAYHDLPLLQSVCCTASRVCSILSSTTGMVVVVVACHAPVLEPACSNWLVESCARQTVGTCSSAYCTTRYYMLCLSLLSRAPMTRYVVESELL